MDDASGATGELREDPPPGTERRDDRDAAVVVEEAVERARAAMAAVADYDQAAADDLARAVALATYREDNAEAIAELALAETGMGTAADKLTKLRERMAGVLEDALGEPTVGELPCDRPGVTEHARPVGVVGALVPSTNPAATVGNVALLALDARNAVVFSAAPVAMETARLTVDLVREELARVGAPRDLVQLLPTPSNKDRAHELLEQADLVQVTGSAANVAAGETCGTPNYCVAGGNLVAVVDETADPAAAAERVAAGTAFEHGTACVAESNVVAHEAVVDDLTAALRSEGGYVCRPEERAALSETLFPDGAIARELVGRPAAVLADAAGFEVPPETSFLLVDGVAPDEPLAGEKLTPVLAAHAVPDFDAALDRAADLLAHAGAGHSATVHTDREARAERAGTTLPVARIAVNQTGIAAAGTPENGLDVTYSLGGGPWAGNQLDQNLSVEQFYTSTRVAHAVDRDGPDAEALLAPVLDGEGSL